MSSISPSPFPRPVGSEPEAATWAGPSAAWPAFVARYQRFLERSARRVLRALGLPSYPDRVEDVTQETYCRLLEMERRDGPGVVAWSEPERVRAFLHRVAWSVVIDDRRRQAAAKRGGAFGPAAPVAADGGCLLDECPSAEPDPETRLLRTEELERVRERLRSEAGGRHPGRNGRIVEMVVLEGCSAAEVVHRLEGSLEDPVTASGLYSLMRRVRLRFASGVGASEAGGGLRTATG